MLAYQSSGYPMAEQPGYRREYAHGHDRGYGRKNGSWTMTLLIITFILAFLLVGSVIWAVLYHIEANKDLEPASPPPTSPPPYIPPTTTRPTTTTTTTAGPPIIIKGNTLSLSGRLSVLSWRYEAGMGSTKSDVYSHYENKFCDLVKHILSGTLLQGGIATCEISEYRSGPTGVVVVHYTLEAYRSNYVPDNQLRAMLMSHLHCGLLDPVANTLQQIGTVGFMFWDNMAAMYEEHPVCDGTCVRNMNGMVYSCPCRDGFRISIDGSQCEDINECLDNNGGCEQICDNTDGSFQCKCKPEYRLDADGRTCNDFNECLVTSDNMCTGGCTNKEGSYECTCSQGWRIDTDGHSCIDIDECQDDNGMCEHTCHNSDGSYNCQCRDGYKLQPDQQSCTDLDECNNENGGCSDGCSNNFGSFHCTCPVGYTLMEDGRQCTDIDECADDNGGCEHRCTNTLGSYRCNCPGGMMVDTVNVLACVDYNECDDSPCVDGACTNVPDGGGFTCSCTLSNYYSARSLCEDLNECEDDTLNMCLTTEGATNCVNRIGPGESYVCECGDGYTHDGGVPGTCVDTDECSSDALNDCSDFCVDGSTPPGSYTCDCGENGDLPLPSGRRGDFIPSNPEFRLGPLGQECFTLSVWVDDESDAAITGGGDDLGGTKTFTCRVQVVATAGAILHISPLVEWVVDGGSAITTLDSTRTTETVTIVDGIRVHETDGSIVTISLPIKAHASDVNTYHCRTTYQGVPFVRSEAAAPIINQP